MKTIIENLLVLWRARAPREQVFLGGLAAFIAGALLVQGLWLAHSARSRLHQQIPQLRLQLANVQRQSGEIRQMQTQSVTAGWCCATGGRHDCRTQHRPDAGGCADAA